MQPKGSPPLQPFQHVPSLQPPDPRVEIQIQRKAEKVTLNRKQRVGIKGREILLKYPKEKAESLMKSLRSKGLWYFDPDFDKDEEDWNPQKKYINESPLL